MPDDAETIIIPETRYTLTEEGTMTLTGTGSVPFTSEDANRLRELMV